MKKLLMVLMLGTCLSIFSCNNDRGNQNTNGSEMQESYEATRDKTGTGGEGEGTGGGIDTSGTKHNRNY